MRDGAAALACIAALAACAHEPPRADAPAPKAEAPGPKTGAPAPKADAATRTETPTPAAASPLAPFGWFAELSGSCWKGDHPDGRTSDTQCYLSQYERLMRGSIKVSTVHLGVTTTVFEGDAVFAWDARRQVVAYTQWGTGGTYALGEMRRNGEALVFINRLPDGNDAGVRSVWQRAGPDGFRVGRERKDESGAWKEFLAVDYHRVR